MGVRVTGGGRVGGAGWSRFLVRSAHSGHGFGCEEDSCRVYTILMVVWW